jgi:hypothetical protein
MSVLVSLIAINVVVSVLGFQAFQDPSVVP